MSLFKTLSPKILKIFLNSLVNYIPKLTYFFNFESKPGTFKIKGTLRLEVLVVLGYPGSKVAWRCRGFEFRLSDSRPDPMTTRPRNISGLNFIPLERSLEFLYRDCGKTA